ncbi:MAG: hypothetical protein HYX22_01005 [Candidatus Yanofskybacteria bacterium]|nr:hypothetical protein [Candidatus Yanofskybacteria bacterium]
MAKKTFDLSRVQRMTDRGKKRLETKEQEQLRKENEALDKEAQTIADQHIAALPGNIKKEARLGSDSLHIYLPDSYKLSNRVERIISSWCWSNRLSVSKRTVHFSDDDGGTVALVISWAKKK